jgi:hypothetical protein
MKMEVGIEAGAETLFGDAEALRQLVNRHLQCG